MYRYRSFQYKTFFLSIQYSIVHITTSCVRVRYVCSNHSREHTFLPFSDTLPSFLLSSIYLTLLRTSPNLIFQNISSPSLPPFSSSLGNASSSCVLCVPSIPLSVSPLLLPKPLGSFWQRRRRRRTHPRRLYGRSLRKGVDGWRRRRKMSDPLGAGTKEWEEKKVVVP